MSQENMEVVERLSSAVNRGDVEGVVSLCSEAIVFFAARSAIEGAYVGHEGMREFLRTPQRTSSGFSSVPPSCSILEIKSS
jgi:ketosteroid isomerase-like protein